MASRGSLAGTSSVPGIREKRIKGKRGLVKSQYRWMGHSHQKDKSTFASSPPACKTHHCHVRQRWLAHFLSVWLPTAPYIQLHFPFYWNCSTNTLMVSASAGAVTVFNAILLPVHISFHSLIIQHYDVAQEKWKMNVSIIIIIRINYRYLIQICNSCVAHVFIWRHRYCNTRKCLCRIVLRSLRIV